MVNAEAEVGGINALLKALVLPINADETSARNRSMLNNFHLGAGTPVSRPLNFNHITSLAVRMYAILFNYSPPWSLMWFCMASGSNRNQAAFDVRSKKRLTLTNQGSEIDVTQSHQGLRWRSANYGVHSNRPPG